MPERVDGPDRVAAWRDGQRRVQARIAATAAAVQPGDGFPHHGDPISGRWTLSPDGDWTGGFWNGLLWLSYLLEPSDPARALAERWAAQLESRVDSETIFRGFLFYYGAALGASLAADEAARELALRGADALASLYNPAASVIPLGSEAEEASDVGLGETSIDGVQGMALLHWAARETGDDELRQIATAHALRHIDLCLRDDGSVCQSASFDAGSGELVRRYTHKGSAADSTWTRAQAWGMLGFAVNAVWRPDVGAFRDAAIRAADWWIEHVPGDSVSYWDFDVPPAPGVERDTSGAAIAAAALLKLAEVTPDPDAARRYRSAAEATVSALVSKHLTAHGILANGCYNRRIGLATANELIWGTYYLFESLLVLNGVVAASSL
jgi:unsaturated chondroitin disaccharide hydrolase